MTSVPAAPRKVFLDANIIIESFRLSVWTALANGQHLETVETCEREALTGDTTSFGRVPVDPAALRAGLKASHIVGRNERNKLASKHPECTTMDPGELDLFAHLFANHGALRPLIVLSSADKNVLVRAKGLGWLEDIISLEELLKSCGVSTSKMKALDAHFTEKFLAEKRVQVMFGVIP